MGATTAIGWTNASWSPWHGCSKVSEGCKNCYALAFSERVGHGKRLPTIWGVEAERKFMLEDHWKLPRRWNRKAARLGTRLRVFCASMADVFEIHADAAINERMNAARARLWVLIEESPHLDWQLLTKRPENIARLIPSRWAAGLPTNIWLGVTAENQARYDERWPLLAEVRASVTFVSYEPALGPLVLTCHGCGFDVGAHCAPDQGGCSGWFPDQVIVGGESGPGRRPFDVEWLRAVADDCRVAGVALFTKQDAGPRPGLQGRIPDDLWVQRFPQIGAAS
jgi:protein gp37